MKKQRKHYTPEEKVAILRRHLLDKEPISKLCVLPLAKRVLRERGSGLRAEEAIQPLSRPRANCLSGEEDPDQGRGPGRAHGGARRVKKRDWGTLIGARVPHDTRDQIVDFVRRWSEKTEIGAGQFIVWLDIAASKFYDWRERYGKVNEHSGWVPRDFWLEDWEKQAIIGFHLKNPLEGYRRLAFMMLDADIAAVSPTSVWRVLGQAGLLSKWNGKVSKKGTGFEQPLAAHQHWHIDVSYVNISGTFYYLCSVLDGCSRYIVNWDLRESMTEADIEIILERAKEMYPEARPRIISDNGPQFIAKDFKEFVRISGMTHVRTSPYYPQSNGKIERWYKSLKGECIRPGTLLSLEDARCLVEGYVAHYNNVRLNSAIGYITPNDMLAGRQQEIHAERDRKLEEARKQRQLRRQQPA
jgi:putative transposase